MKKILLLLAFAISTSFATVDSTKQISTKHIPDSILIELKNRKTELKDIKSYVDSIKLANKPRRDSILYSNFREDKAKIIITDIDRHNKSVSDTLAKYREEIYKRIRESK